MSLAVLMLLEGEFPSIGGAERQVETLSNALQSRGLGITVVVPRFNPSYAAGAAKHGDLEVWRIAYPPVRVLGSLFLMLRFAWLARWPA